MSLLPYNEEDMKLLARPMRAEAEGKRNSLKENSIIQLPTPYGFSSQVSVALHSSLIHFIQVATNLIIFIPLFKRIVPMFTDKCAGSS